MLETPQTVDAKIMRPCMGKKVEVSLLLRMDEFLV